MSQQNDRVIVLPVQKAATADPNAETVTDGAGPGNDRTEGTSAPAPDGVGAAAKNFGRALGRAAGRTAGRAAHGAREGIRKNPTANSVYRTGVGVVGGGTVALGVVMMPLPGPGALVALGGLGILSTEFEGAKKVRHTAEGAAKKAFTAAKGARDRRKESREG
jgi:uncharacterized protein (TIGR02611 family)